MSARVGALSGALIAEATSAIASSAWLGVGLGLVGWAIVMRRREPPVMWVENAPLLPEPLGE